MRAGPRRLARAVCLAASCSLLLVVAVARADGVRGGQSPRLGDVQPGAWTASDASLGQGDYGDGYDYDDDYGDAYNVEHDLRNDDDKDRDDERDHADAAAEEAWIGASGRYNETTALYLAHVTSVSYCQEAHVRNWSCGPCALVPPLQDVRVVQDARDDFQGLVGFSALYRAVVVAFRGSMDVRNWLDNLSFLKKRAYAQFPGVEVHEGFYWAYRSVAADVTARVRALRARHPDAPLVVTGHSLGGAVAAICAFEMKYLERQPVRQLYTFGKPRVGNAAFSALLRNSSLEVYRVTHFRDVVPHLPPQFVGFYHTTQEIFYDQFSSSYRNCSRVDGEDAACSNNCSVWGCTSIVDHLTYLNITMSHLIC